VAAGFGYHLTVPPEPEAYYRSRRVADFYQRAKLGPLFYLAGIIVVAVVARYFNEFATVVFIWMLAFGLLYRLRIIHRPPQNTADIAATRVWWREHWAIEKLGCVLWSVVFIGVGQIELQANTSFLVAVICTIAYASAVSDVFSMDRKQAWASIVILMWPAILVLYVTSSSLRASMVTLAVYSAYLLIYARRRAHEYSTQLENEVDLLTSRAAVERLSRTDALTGLANRREYVSVVDWTWNQVSRSKESLSLMVIDLDFFKHINDRHGHSVGDACLSHVATILSDTFRRTNDFVARIGGEEFVVLLPGTVLSEATERAEVFRRQLETNSYQYRGRAIPLTASIGVGAVDLAHDATPDATFSRIDRACYQAKAAGRNRVVTAGS
jgi:diguanylate cyclase (GGDEF)-like protein